MEIVMRHEARQVPSWLIFDVSPENMNIPIQLPPAVTIFVGSRDGLSGAIAFSESNLRDLTTHLLYEIGKKYGFKQVRALKEGEPIFPNDGFFESTVHRVSRDSKGFADAFVSEVGKLAEELRSAEPFDGLYVLEARFSDDIAFAKENMFGDYLYIYARLIRKKG